MSNVKVSLSPRLQEWGRGNPKGLREGTVAGSKKLAPRVEAEVRTRLFIGSGAYRKTVTSKVYASGMAVIHSTDKIKRKTWLESGRRKGVKLWKGTGAWAAGKRLAKSENKAGYYEREIASRL